MVFSLVVGDILYGCYWGCLVEFDWLYFEICFYQGLEFVIGVGLVCFDVGVQGEYKLICGFELVLMCFWYYLVYFGLCDVVVQFFEQEWVGVCVYVEEVYGLLFYCQV